MPETSLHLHADAGKTLLLRLPDRLGTASNLVITSARPQQLRGRYRHLSGTASQGVWSTARLDFLAPPGGIAKLHFGAFGGPLAVAGVSVTACWPTCWPSRLGQQRLQPQAPSPGPRCRPQGPCQQLAEHYGGQRGPAKLRHRNYRSTLTINNSANAGNFTTVGDVSMGTLTASGAATAGASQPPGRLRAPR